MHFGGLVALKSGFIIKMLSRTFLVRKVSKWCEPVHLSRNCISQCYQMDLKRENLYHAVSKLKLDYLYSVLIFFISKTLLNEFQVVCRGLRPDLQVYKFAELFLCGNSAEL